ncbi:hypothetical protein [Bacillus toyonensis]|uniref:hypothetical protein n=1 Tax=Bacillus toyonensis TaxID=155322 RepID=UPI000BF8C908|nr:hypothetical protein [Bacillus toyonensis]PGF04985.1 hypothetical protein COM61_00665 [Bacillus toyonensis]
MYKDLEVRIPCGKTYHTFGFIRVTMQNGNILGHPCTPNQKQIDTQTLLIVDDYVVQSSSYEIVINRLDYSKHDGVHPKREQFALLSKNLKKRDLENGYVVARAFM